MATAPKEAHVINDAILMAAVDLNKRERTRRKIIFVISNGREYGSKASYSAVLKVLQTNNITVYGLGMGTNIVPGLNKLQRLHIPRLGTDDILPKYASATGGEILAGASRKDIDDVYAQAIGDARNQYTIGYNTRAAPGAAYRDIEVRTDRPDCSRFAPPCVRTRAKAGYYPTAPAPLR
jgi:VWFA-related protein